MYEDFLALDGYAVIPQGCTETDTAILIKARLLDVPTQCAESGGVLLRNGSYSRTFTDIPRGAKSVKVQVDVPRLYCSECSGTHGVKLPGLDLCHNLTLRLIAYMHHQFEARMPLVQVTRLTGVSTRTVARIYQEWVATQEAVRIAWVPQYMGLDEIRVAGGLRGIITDIGAGKPIELLKDNRKSTICDFLRAVPRNENIQAVAIDLCWHFRELLYEVLPHVVVVADKAHVLLRARKQLTAIRLKIGRGFVEAEVVEVSGLVVLPTDETVAASLESKAQKAADRVRRNLNQDQDLFTMVYSTLTCEQQSKLEVWFLQFPLLREAHAFLQKLYDLYAQAISSSEAKAAFETAKVELSPEAQALWLPFFRTVERFDSEIWAYFDTGLTNAYTESANRTIRDLTRMCRGIKYEALRAKLLYTHCPSIDAERRTLRTEPSLTMPDSPAANGSKYRQYGNARKTNRRTKIKPEPAQSQLFPGPLPGADDDPESDA